MARQFKGVAGFLREFYLPAVASALIAICLLLLWFGLTSTKEWQRSMHLLMEQRSSEALTLMIMALSRDMRGVQSQVLPQLESFDTHSAKYALANEIATAFARFPYPESFFTWTADKTQGTLYVFNRTDRLPPWQNNGVQGVRFPVMILEDPDAIQPLIKRIRSQTSRLTPVVIFETGLAGRTYQVVARLRYGGPSDTSLQNIVGFMVNIDWARRHYFSEMTSQLSRILAGQTNTALTILDENRTVIATNGPSRPDHPLPDSAVHEEQFPLLFFEPSLRSAAQSGALHERYWTARAEALMDETLEPLRSARRNMVLISVATAAAGVALFLTVRSVRSAALLAAMKSEFVSAVTHELKTPLSSISLAVQTLVKGRIRSQEDASEYAGLLLSAVSRLNRTVDNLLAIARAHDAPGFYHFESVDLIPVLEQALDRFQLHLNEHSFHVEMDVPASLPPVKADRAAMLQVLDNILDNAIRYSNGSRSLKIAAFTTQEHVNLHITDHGSGIPADELPHVFEKFFRGSNTSSAGSGLGLAIAERVMKDHHGEIRIRSAPGVGTTVEVRLDLANEDGEHEPADLGR